MAHPNIQELHLLHDHLCRALSDPRRMQILYALHEQPQHVTVLAEALDIPQPTVSRHLAVLRQCALVTNERDGTTITYSIAHPEIITIIDQMRGLLRKTLDTQSQMLEVATT